MLYVLCGKSFVGKRTICEEVVNNFDNIEIITPEVHTISRLKRVNDYICVASLSQAETISTILGKKGCVVIYVTCTFENRLARALNTKDFNKELWLQQCEEEDRVFASNHIAHTCSLKIDNNGKMSTTIDSFNDIHSIYSR